MTEKLQQSLVTIHDGLTALAGELWPSVTTSGMAWRIERLAHAVKLLLPSAEQADADREILDHLDQNFFHQELDDWDVKMNALKGRSMKFCTYVPHRNGGGTARSRIMEQLTLLRDAEDTDVPLFARDIIPELRTAGEAVYDYTKPQVKPAQPAEIAVVAEEPLYVRTKTEHVYLNQATGKYTYSDETENFVAAEFDSEEEAKRALQAYCCFALDKPMTVRERCIEVEHHIQCVVDKAPVDGEVAMYARNAAWEMGKLSVQVHAKESQLTYLAAPYTGTKEQVEARMQLFYRVMAKLDYQGSYTCSPLLKHAIFAAGDVELPSDWEYWQHYSRIMLNQCSQVVVVCLNGWRDSVGVMGEIEHARKIGVPVMYVDEFGNQLSPATVI